ncbi:hypothetical protein B0H16DRAFT_1890279 [Mycena metata]|uniref:Uncharacterized protein n=1 Tax=Mycena metata TaxID=1033252 RepID=A0AAD7N1R9_9AGAR|nr:hypothetical protein B0H16DRAFT_1890279 [Mycena metata]
MGIRTAVGRRLTGGGAVVRDAESMEVALVGPLTSAVGGAGVGEQQASFNVLADVHVRRPPRPSRLRLRSGTRAPPSSTPALTGSVFALPYCMLYAVVTMDTLAIYDTQAGPVCLPTKRVYGFGMCLMLSSRDGYCTLVTVDEILPTRHTQPQPSIRCRCTRRARIALQAAVGARWEQSVRWGPDAGGECPWDRERDVVIGSAGAYSSFAFLCHISIDASRLSMCANHHSRSRLSRSTHRDSFGKVISASYGLESI